MFEKGDAIKVRGKKATAMSSVYTKMVYDLYDLDMSSRYSGYEGGTARSYLDVMYEDGSTSSVPAIICTKA